MVTNKHVLSENAQNTCTLLRCVGVCSCCSVTDAERIIWYQFQLMRFQSRVYGSKGPDAIPSCGTEACSDSRLISQIAICVSMVGFLFGRKELDFVYCKS